MNTIKGYSSLPSQLQALFTSTYNKHMAAMGSEERKSYSIDHIKQIKWNNTVRCLIVSFKNGDWWSYDSKDGSWY